MVLFPHETQQNAKVSEIPKVFELKYMEHRTFWKEATVTVKSVALVYSQSFIVKAEKIYAVVKYIKFTYPVSYH